MHDSLLDQISPIRDNLRYLQHLVVTTAANGPRQLNFGELMARASSSLEPADTNSDDAAFWLYSSGTTGSPKGAIHLHHDMIVEADHYARSTIGLLESDVSFSVAKLFFAYGLGNGLYFPLAHRRNHGAAARPAGARKGLRGHRPLPAHGLLRRADELRGPAAPRRENRPDRASAACGCALRPARRSRGRSSSAGASGSTWRSSTASAPRKSCTSSSRTDRARPRPGSTGQIVPGYEARIVDDNGRDLPAGQVGTLLIRGESVAAGYWNKHAATKQTFCGEWINTHDKFMVDPDGYFWYAGRADDMMKVSGQAVWPAEVEGVLQGHPAVLESGVTGATDDAKGCSNPSPTSCSRTATSPRPNWLANSRSSSSPTRLRHKYPRGDLLWRPSPRPPRARSSGSNCTSGPRWTACYVRNSAEPHTNPEPNATNSVRLPGRTMPACRASCKAIGSDAEPMLP